jgi:hypothetical protein
MVAWLKTQTEKASRAAGHPVYRFRAGEDLGDERLDAHRVTARAGLTRAPRVQPGRYRDPPVEATVLGDQPPTWPWLRADDHVGLDLLTGGRFCTGAGLLGLLLGGLAGLLGAFCLRRLHLTSPRCTRTFQDFGVQTMDLDDGGPFPQWTWQRGFSPDSQLRRGRGTGGAILQADFKDGVLADSEVCQETGKTGPGLVARHPTRPSLIDDDFHALRHWLVDETADLFRCVRQLDLEMGDSLQQTAFTDWPLTSPRTSGWFCRETGMSLVAWHHIWRQENSLNDDDNHVFLREALEPFGCADQVDLSNLAGAARGRLRALFDEYEVKKKVESTRPYTSSDHLLSRAKKTGGCTVSSEVREWGATKAVRESAFLKKQGKAVVERALSRQGSADKK